MNEHYLLRDIFMGGSWLAGDPLVTDLVKRHLTFDVFCALGTNYEEYELKKKEVMSKEPIKDWLDLKRSDAESSELIKDWLDLLLKERFVAPQSCGGMNLTFTDSIVCSLSDIIDEVGGRLFENAWRHRYFHEMNAYELWGVKFSFNSIAQFLTDHDGHFVAQEQNQSPGQSGSATTFKSSKQKDATRALEHDEKKKAEKAAKLAKSKQLFSLCENEYVKAKKLEKKFAMSKGEMDLELLRHEHVKMGLVDPNEPMETSDTESIKTLDLSDSADDEGKQTESSGDVEFVCAKQLQPSGSSKSARIPFAEHAETNWISKRKRTIEYRRSGSGKEN